jgi:hypothetical protein
VRVSDVQGASASTTTPLRLSSHSSAGGTVSVVV